MTQEEFKAIFLKQFRDVDSPIRDLMQAPFAFNQTGERMNTYLSSCDFLASEFGLRVEVDSLGVSPAGQALFQLYFNDLSKVGNSQAQHPNRELSSPKYQHLPFRFEDVSFTESSIVFGTHTFFLDATDYVYTRSALTHRQWAVFDVSAQRFITENLDEVSNQLFIETLQYQDAGINVQYTHTKPKEAELLRFLRANNIPSLMEEMYLNLFQRAMKGVVSTTTLVLIKDLIRVQQRQ